MSMNVTDQSTGPIDRNAVLRQRARAALSWAEYYRNNTQISRAIDPAAPDFLIREVANRLGDRLLDINRHYARALDIGCHSGQLAAMLPTGRVGQLFSFDRSLAMVTSIEGQEVSTFVGDEEMIPIADNSMDLVLSCLDLQWVNDLPGSLAQIRRILKPDGLFLAAVVGGESLTELRQSLLQAETAVSGGVSPRVLPMIDLRDAGALLQRAGFALPVVDVDELTFEYNDPFALIRELRGLGWQNALSARRKNFTARAVFSAMAEHYFADFANAEGRLPASFQILYLTAWAPHENQQQPLTRGSAKTPLADVI
jgi:SAM-dependent methyltransferase